MAAAAAGGASRRAFEVFVHRIPWTVAKDEIKTYFAQFGPVKKCIMPFNKETGFYKGICWVAFFTEESFTNALQKESHILEGVKISVEDNKARIPSQKMDGRINDIS